MRATPEAGAAARRHPHAPLPCLRHARVRPRSVDRARVYEVHQSRDHDFVEYRRHRYSSARAGRNRSRSRGSGGRRRRTNPTAARIAHRLPHRRADRGRHRKPAARAQGDAQRGRERDRRHARPMDYFRRGQLRLFCRRFSHLYGCDEDEAARRLRRSAQNGKRRERARCAGDGRRSAPHGRLRLRDLDHGLRRSRGRHGRRHLRRRRDPGRGPRHAPATPRRPQSHSRAGCPERAQSSAPRTAQHMTGAVRITAAAALAASFAFASDLLLRGVTVVDVKTGELHPRTSLVIHGDRIQAIASNIRYRRGMRVLDARGKYAIPGLWDMHVHLGGNAAVLASFVAWGTTGVRDFGSDSALVKQWRKEIDADLPREAYLALVERARKWGLPVAGDVPEDVTLDEAVTARQDSIEHLSGTLKPEELDRMARYDTYITPLDD